MLMLDKLALYARSWWLVEVAEAFDGISCVPCIRGWVGGGLGREDGLVTATRKHRQPSCMNILLNKSSHILLVNFAPQFSIVYH